MRRIKTQRPDITKGPDKLTVIARAKRVATIFDHKQIVAIGDLHHATQVKWIAQRMRQHNRPGLIGNSFFQP